MPETLPPPHECPIGWIGTGVMGSAMVGHLLDAGHPVVVTTRTAERARPLVERGARWADSPAEVSAGALVVGVMVGTPTDVQAVIAGDGTGTGVLEALAPGAAIIDFTTSTPSLAAELATAGAERGISVLDAPVSGGDVGARDATLSIMIGGDTVAFDRCRPLLDRLGHTIVHHGPAGSGQHAKAVNQTLVAGTMIGLCEALVYAHRAGLDPGSVLASVSGGAAASWSLTNLAPRILSDDLAPGFAVRHFVKDLGIVLAESSRMGLVLPGVQLADELYRDLVAHDEGELGTHALVRAIERRVPHR